MQNAETTSFTQRRSRGFSLIELLIVIAVIAAMAAASMPSILAFIKNYRIMGAAEGVARELQAARSKAITRNVNRGVVFAAIDANTYRYVIQDSVPLDGSSLPAEAVGVLSDLPLGVEFVPATVGTVGPGLRFDRLGRACNIAVENCNDMGGIPNPPCEGEAACSDRPADLYVGQDANTGEWVIQVMETSSGLTAFVRVRPGGRIQARPAT